MPDVNGYPSWEAWRDSLYTDRAASGTRGSEIGSVRYASFERNEKPDQVFEWVIDAVNPPHIRNGGAVRDGCIVTTPDGASFFPFVINPDIELDGWIRQIEEGASLLGRLSAKIEGEDFILSDGRSFSLSECVVEFD